MKSVILFCFLILFSFALMVGNAIGQEEIIVMDNEALGPHRRPLVSFNHELHMEGIECIRCHHDFDTFGYNAGAEGLPCSDCHSPKGENGLVRLKTAYHRQCKGCHEAVKESVRPDLPVMCGQCHIRKKAEE